MGSKASLSSAGRGLRPWFVALTCCLWLSAGAEIAVAQNRLVAPVTDAEILDPPAEDWLMFRGNLANWGYSALDKISRENVNQLDLAWAFTMEEGPIETTPVVRDGVIFLPNPGDVIHALDASTGDLIWEYRREWPEDFTGGGQGMTIASIVRSIALYGDSIYTTTADAKLVRLNASTGEVIWESSTDNYNFTTHTTGPIIVKGKVISGRNCSAALAGGCYIMAHDAEDGRELWRFYVIPRPGEPGSETWGKIPLEERLHVGAWHTGAYDPDTDLIYWGTSVPAPSPEVLRGSGDGHALYSNSTVALDPDTGELVWYFQHLPRDNWDLDHPYERLLVDVEVEPDPEAAWVINPDVAYGEKRKVLTGIPGKTGIVWTLDRKTGQFLWARPTVEQNVISAIDPETGAVTVNENTILRSLEDEYGTVCPSAGGGKNWPASSYSPRTQTMYAPLQNTCMEPVVTTDDPKPEDLYAISFNLRLTPGVTNVGRLEAVSARDARTVWRVDEPAGVDVDASHRRRSGFRRLFQPAAESSRCRDRRGVVGVDRQRARVGLPDQLRDRWRAVHRGGRRWRGSTQWRVEPLCRSEGEIGLERAVRLPAVGDRSGGGSRYGIARCHQDRAAERRGHRRRLVGFRSGTAAGVRRLCWLYFLPGRAGGGDLRSALRRVCHGGTLRGGNHGSPLSGRFFKIRWNNRRASALHATVQETMPPGGEGSLGGRATSSFSPISFRPQISPRAMTLWRPVRRLSSSCASAVSSCVFAASRRGNSMKDIKVYDWARYNADVAPDKTAIHDLDNDLVVSYGDLEDRVGRLAAYLRDEIGVEQGDRLAVLSLNSPEMLELQFACMRLGTVFVPLNFRLAVPELEYIVGDCAPKALFTDPGLEATARVVAAAAGVAHVVTATSDRSDCTYEQAIEGRKPVTEIVDMTLDDLWTIMYTSGTTGRPKGAMITHSMCLFNAINLGAPAKIDARCVQYTFMPLFHTGGLNVFTNPALHCGATVLLTRAFDPGEVLARISDPALGVTHFLGVPAMFQFMAQHPSFESADFSRLVSALVGAAPMPVSTLQIWLDRGVALQQGYGMTETGPSCLGLAAEDAGRKIGSAGKPVLHTELKVLGDDGDPVGADEVGVLWVKGPTITPGYWNKPEANESSFVDGWLDTGDAVTVDEEGFYYIVDRTKDMYISGGENVYPAEVENVIYQVPEILEAAVIGVADEKWGEVGRAVVVLKEGQAIDEAEIISHCAANLAKFKVPAAVVFTDVLPRNATGKVLKPICARRTVESRASPDGVRGGAGRSRRDPSTVRAGRRVAADRAGHRCRGSGAPGPPTGSCSAATLASWGYSPLAKIDRDKRPSAGSRLVLPDGEGPQRGHACGAGRDHVPPQSRRRHSCH